MRLRNRTSVLKIHRATSISGLLRGMIAASWVIVCLTAGCGGGSKPQTPAAPVPQVPVATPSVKKPAVVEAKPAEAAPPPAVENKPSGGGNVPAGPAPAANSAPVEKSNNTAPVNSVTGGATSEESGREYFALVGKPSAAEEEFVLKGEDDGTERMNLTDLPRRVDGTMFRVSGGGGTSRGTASGNGERRVLPKEVEVLEDYGYSPDGLPFRIRLTTKDPVEMALVSAGAFTRGRGGEGDENGPEQSVYLDSYYMDVVEVTVERYLKMREEHKKESRSFTMPSNQKSGDDQPALGIGHGDAEFYAKWAGKELPSEAQWEKAARGTEGGQYPWGNGRPIWHRKRVPEQIDPVGSFPSDASPYGVLDLAGNANEWCRDTYSPKAYLEIGATPEKLRNPIYTRKLAGETVYVVRGGGVRGSSSDWSVWQRGSEKGTARNPTIGFRCVYQLP